MKKDRNKIAVLLISLILILSMVFVACKKEEATPDKTQQPEATKAVETAQATQEEELVPEKIAAEPFEINVYAYEHASQPWEASPKIFERIFELTNVRVNLESVPQSDYKDKLNIMFGTNNFPDLVKTGGGGNGMISEYAGLGIFLELDALIAEHAPNYQRLMDTDPNIAMLKYDDKTYGFTTINTSDNVPSAATLALRVDLLDKNNIAAPETMEELLDAMAQLKDIYPEAQPWTTRGGTGDLLNCSSFMLGSGYKFYFEPTVGGGQWMYGQATENFKYVLDYFQRAYAKGVLDIDYATMTTQLWHEKMNTGHSFMYIQNAGFSFTHTANLRETDPEAWLTIIPVPENQQTGDARCYLYPGNYTEMFVINSAVKDPVTIVKFMDWCYSEEGTHVCNFGVEGLSYELVEGQPQVLKSYMEQFKDATDFKYAFDASLGTGLLGWAPNVSWSKVLDSVNAASGQADDPDRAAYNEIMLTDDAYRIAVLAPPFTDEELERIADIMTPINTYLTPLYDQFILGEKSVDEWDEVIQALKEMNIQEAVDIYNTAYERAVGR